MNLGRYIFVSLIIAFYLALSYLIGLRGWETLGRLPFLQITVYRAVFAVIVVSGFVGIVVNRLLPYSLQGGFYLFGSYWFAALIYFTLFIVGIDILRLLDRLLGFIPKALGTKADFPLIIGVSVCVLVAVLLAYGTLQARNIKVVPYEITIPKQAGSLEQLHVVMIFDIHLSSIDDKREKRIIDVVSRLNPDIVLIPGDIVDNMMAFDQREMARDFQKIKSRYGVYASLGNHDYLNGDLAYLTDCLREAGITVLRDSRVKVGESLYIVGREDESWESATGKRRLELAEIMRGINRELPVILLDHRPIDLEEARDAGVDLQLSGHTHKGQFFPVNLFTRRIFETDYGYLKTGTLQLIVSSGAGTWGPPIRIGSSCEVVDITLRFANQ
jgi:predicted MPP superfamily phosphohydrolase